MKRVPTGVTGLDGLLEGGFPEGRSILVSGGCGTGKTIFSLQYIIHGAMEMGEPGLYVTLDERPELIREDVRRFGWDLAGLEAKGLVSMVDGSMAKLGLPSDENFQLPAQGFDLDKLLLEIMRIIRRTSAKRLVIDSIPAMGFNYENQTDIRKALLKLSDMLQRSGVTSILTSEIAENAKRFSRYGVEEYLADGVILLHYMGVGTRSNRTLHIRKMRATKHSEDLHPLEITETGIVIHSIEDEYRQT
jgi:KaiC/GvpD/RAD55 family RecA-like ATPase